MISIDWSPMKPDLDMNKIARALRAERTGEVSRWRELFRSDAAAGGHRDAGARAPWWADLSN